MMNLQRLTDTGVIALAAIVLGTVTDFVDKETGEDVWIPTVAAIRKEIVKRKLEKRLFDTMFDCVEEAGRKYEATRSADVMAPQA